MYGPFTARYLVKKSAIHMRRPPGLHERTSDNIAIAKTFEKTSLDTISEEKAAEYRAYSDVQLEDYQCSLPGYNDDEKAISQMWSTLRTATTACGNQQLTDDLWEAALQMCEGIRPRDDHIVAIDETIRQATKYSCLTIVDRDPARRASMEADGYRYRLYHHFASTPEVYRERRDITVEGSVVYRHAMAIDFLPKRFWKKAWPADSTPYAYHTYKAKCFRDNEKAWACTSTHSHIREIVSSASDPTRRWMSTMARCIRVLHRSMCTDKKRSFILWNQSRVPEEFSEKAKHLRTH
jgi:hypothetical protein